MYLKKIAAIVVMTFAAPALAETYVCNVKPVSSGKQNAPISSAIQIEFSGGSVVIEDDFLREAGKRGTRGKFDRQVGDDLLFSWSVNGVPRHLMPTEVTWYRQSVNYRARLDTRTNRISMRADYVARYGGGNTGTDIRGVGICKLS